MQQQEEAEKRAKQKSALSPDVEELFRMWLEKSVTQSVQNREFSAVTSQPSRSSTTEIARHVQDTMTNLQTTTTTKKQKPCRPPPPRRRHQSNHDVTSNASISTTYEDVEAGTPATLPRKTKLSTFTGVRPKNVNFDPAPTTKFYLSDYDKTAVIRRSPTPYRDARQLLNEL